MMWALGDLACIWTMAAPGPRHRGLQWPAMFAVASALFAAAAFALDSPETDTTSPYADFNPRDPGTCGLSSAQSALIGDKFYILGGYFRHQLIDNNNTRVGMEMAPNMWLRILDTSKPFNTAEIDSLPITFEDPPASIPEISDGSLWAYNNSLWLHGGHTEYTDSNEQWPGFNALPSDTVYEFVKYDIARDSWLEDQRTLDQTYGPMKNIIDGFSVVVESLGKAFLLGGVFDGTKFPLQPAWGLVTYDFESDEWEQLPRRWLQWTAGLAVHVSVEDSGYILAFAGKDRENNNLDQIDIYDISYRVWQPIQTATAADPRLGIPNPRAEACYVIARAKDGSSYNIYVFGGSKLNVNLGYNDVWILSIPSFTWHFAGTGDAGGPPNLRSMECALVGGGRKMLVYGGLKDLVDDYNCLHPSLTYIFDITSLRWEESYEPNATAEYEVPKAVYDVIGGGPHGGATLLPESGFASPAMEKQFLKIIAKVNATSNGTDPERDSGASDSNPSPVSPDIAKPAPARVQLPAGTIAGIAVGSALGFISLGLGIFFLARWRKTTRPTPYIPPAELAGGQLDPRELEVSHKHIPAQELHGYTAPELHAQDSGGYTAPEPHAQYSGLR